MTLHPTRPTMLMPQASGLASTLPSTPSDPPPRILSADAVQELVARATRHATGGGYTGLLVRSQWVGNVRWARNRILSTGEDQNTHILVMRDIQGARPPFLYINETADAALAAAVRETEALLRLDQEGPNDDLLTHVQLEPELKPPLFVQATYALDPAQRAAIAQRLMRSASEAGMLSAGYVEVMAFSTALVTSFGVARYDQYTWGRCSLTVRDPKGTGSGWAGVDWPDWNKIDGDQLAALALDKCLKSRNPVAAEPGRYTTILEPQAVGDLVGETLGSIFGGWNFFVRGEQFNERPGQRLDPGEAKLGEKVVDERLTISIDPMDPVCGFPPWREWGGAGDGWAKLISHVFHSATWVKHGVLTELADASRYDGVTHFGRNEGRPQSGAVHIDVSGPTTSMEEMIATTKRGLLVTRFDRLSEENRLATTYRGYTRDGLWLIENGKITKPLVNLAMTESVMRALNAIEQVGAPQRVFRPKRPGWSQQPEPAFVPAMKIRDFSFTALADSV